METINLPRYVSLLKNLRAVAFLDPTLQPPIKEIEWLRRRYRYRNVGISESLLKVLKAETRRLFLKNPFETLKSPLPEIDKFMENILDVEPKVPEYIIESLILTSCYVNALIVLGRESLSVLRPFTAWGMKSTAELPENEIKRNLRIVGYAILDFHDKVIRQAYSTLKKVVEKLRKEKNLDAAKEELEKLVDKRRKMAKSDGEKRFWRLKQTGGEKERTVIAYFDIIPLISERLLQSKASKLVKFIAESTSNLSMALSLIPAFILEFD